MDNQELLKKYAEVLTRNVDSTLTNELASGLYGSLQQILDQLNPKKEDPE